MSGITMAPIGVRLSGSELAREGFLVGAECTSAFASKLAPTKTLCQALTDGEPT